MENHDLLVTSQEGIECTLKSLIEEHARLDFSDFLSTLLAIFHVIRRKIPPCSFIKLLSKKAGKVEFFSNPACLFWFALLLGTSELLRKDIE